MIRESSLNDIHALPVPAWCVNGHLHTIARSLLGDSRLPPHERIEISTPDGDFLELDIIRQNTARPVAVLFHGLEGSTRRYYMAELMKELKEEHYSVVGVNFRSCGSRLNRRRRFYHSGETDDYATVFKWVRESFPGRPIGAVGFSLGGNALLKSLGEEKEGHPVKAAVAVSVPYDLRLGSLQISRGFNKVYEYRFLRTLRKKLAEKRQTYSDLPRFDGNTLYEFDEQVTSVVHGFSGAEDYYRRCSARKFVEHIRKPTLVIHSEADPLCPIQAMPMDKINDNPFLDYVITREGGHVGFWSSPSGWLNYLIRNYFSRKFD